MTKAIKIYSFSIMAMALAFLFTACQKEELKRATIDQNKIEQLVQMEQEEDPYNESEAAFNKDYKSLNAEELNLYVELKSKFDIQNEFIQSLPQADQQSYFTALKNLRQITNTIAVDHFGKTFNLLSSEETNQVFELAEDNMSWLDELAILDIYFDIYLDRTSSATDAATARVTCNALSFPNFGFHGDNPYNWCCTGLDYGRISVTQDGDGDCDYEFFFPQPPGVLCEYFDGYSLTIDNCLKAMGWMRRRNGHTNHGYTNMIVMGERLWYFSQPWSLQDGVHQICY